MSIENLSCRTFFIDRKTSTVVPVLTDSTYIEVNT